jgi:hypothetical protein
MAKNCEGWAALFEVDNVLRNQTVFRDEIGKIPLRRQGIFAYGQRPPLRRLEPSSVSQKFRL